MDLNTYLLFDGSCEAAFKFYEKVLGGKIVMMMTHAEMPAGTNVPEDWKKKIMHARLQLGDKFLMASDAPPGRFEAAKGFYVNISVKDPAEADRLFGALSAKGTVNMPIQETFWAHRFGMLVDQFGTPWMINCEKAAA
jgi:PhnB protein